MKVLVLSFYFQPDLCAGSFRNTAFVKGLKKIKQADVDVCYLVLKVKILFLIFLILKISFQSKDTKSMK